MIIISIHDYMQFHKQKLKIITIIPNSILLFFLSTTPIDYDMVRVLQLKLFDFKVAILFEKRDTHIIFTNKLLQNDVTYKIDQLQ